jgi:hypothetical protein
MSGLAASSVNGMAASSMSGNPEAWRGLCRADSLPADIREALHSSFEDWRIEEPQDLSQNALARWMADTPQSCPGIVSGHLKNRRSLDYVLLMVSRDSQAYRLYVFTEQGRNLYAFKLLAQSDTDARDTFLNHANPPARYLPPRSSSAGDGILLIGVGEKGTGTMLFYWDQGDYQMVTLP